MNDTNTTVTLKPETHLRTTFGVVATVISLFVVAAFVWATLRAEVSRATTINQEQAILISSLDVRMRKVEATHASVAGMRADMRAVREILERQQRRE